MTITCERESQTDGLLDKTFKTMLLQRLTAQQPRSRGSGGKSGREVLDHQSCGKARGQKIYAHALLKNDMPLTTKGGAGTPDEIIKRSYTDFWRDQRECACPRGPAPKGTMVAASNHAIEGSRSSKLAAGSSSRKFRNLP